MTIADTDEEVCLACKYYLGPIIGICGCPDSEFAKSMVHPAGYCNEFKRRSHGERDSVANGSET